MLFKNSLLWETENYDKALIQTYMEEKKEQLSDDARNLRIILDIVCDLDTFSL
jgi:hypothetical protein